MTTSISDYHNGITASGYGGSATIGPFNLLGGRYAIIVLDTGTADAQLQVLGPDGSTYVNVGAAVVTNGYDTADLPAGKYEVTTGTGTSLSISVLPIPYRAGQV